MMPSNALFKWKGERQANLNEFANAHRSVGGVKPGRRHQTQQINHGYVVLLSSQFQAFCRDLHSEAVDRFAAQFTPPIREIIASEFRFARKLDAGNPSPGNIGADFNRLGLAIWPESVKADVENARRRDELEQLNRWRNAIAHDDFDAAKLGGSNRIQLAVIRRWRQTCDELARTFDALVRTHLIYLTGHSPW